LKIVITDPSWQPSLRFFLQAKDSNWIQSSVNLVCDPKVPACFLVVCKGIAQTSKIIGSIFRGCSQQLTNNVQII